ncbi:MAG: efflux RND transporter periplasmic adaptor subunit [Deltaproteobacteria bacterium]|nr:efflux RND transporter periplasmic adaptor subunit [Deltaproteobacteria bacterium]
MRRLWKSLGWVLALAALGGAGLWVHQRYFKGPAPLGERVRTVALGRGPIAAKVTATGTLSALVTVQVGSQVSGRIAELHADFNSPVKKGQVIARIDSQLFEASVAQSKANLLAAEGNLARSRAQAAEADRQLERQKALAGRQLIAQAELDTALANAEAAHAGVQASQGSVEQAKASLSQAKVNLAYTTIVSPIDGVVISRNVDVGQTVAASLQAPTLFTIAEDLARMQVHTNVAEADIGKLKPEMVATFLVDAYPQVPFTGTIRQIRNSPINVQNVVTYDAVIDVENPDLKLKPGMTANVTVIWAQTDDVLRVPNQALRFRPSADLLPTVPEGAAAAASPAGAKAERRSRSAGAAGNPAEKQVWALREGALEQVSVTAGLTDGTYTEVAGGRLREGDLVVIEAVSESSEAPKTGGSPFGGPPQVRGARRMGM